MNSWRTLSGYDKIFIKMSSNKKQKIAIGKSLSIIQKFASSSNIDFCLLNNFNPYLDSHAESEMNSNLMPTLNQIIFNPSILEDFLIENKQNKPQIIELLQMLSHDLFSGRSKDSKVYQMILNLVISIVHYFQLQINDLENLFSFEFNKQLFKQLVERDTKQYYSEYFRLSCVILPKITDKLMKTIKQFLPE